MARVAAGSHATVIHTFDGAVTVVTGGASGIGRGIAVEAGRRGSHVVIADINEARLGETLSEIEEFGASGLKVHCDVTKDDDVERLRDAVLDTFGHIDLLCNNAGVAVLGPPERADIKDWQWILDVNVLGIARGLRAFVPSMLERGRGHIVNTASIGGVWAYSWDSPLYITSKFAVYGLTEALARRLAPHGVGVSVLCPGLVATNLGETARVSGVPEDLLDKWFFFPPEMQSPVEPAVVGALVADAVIQDRFAIFTDANDAERFRTWRVDIEGSLREVIASSPPPPTF